MSATDAGEDLLSTVEAERVGSDVPGSSLLAALRDCLAPDVPPELLNHPRQFKDLVKLGSGGMGTVYKALCAGWPVALKVIRRDRRDAGAVKRFRREADAGGKLSHPNVVTVYDLDDRLPDYHLLIMEFLEGEDLHRLLQRRRVERRGALPIADACQIIRQAAQGLQHIHERGVVHRDVKPSNLMLTTEGNVKLLDMGLVLLCSDNAGDTSVTSTGQFLGTVDYMSPEQITDARRVGIRGDIYSLGCTLYHLLAGKPPFHGRKYGTVISKAVAQTRDPLPRVRRRDVPPTLQKIIAKMTAKKPGKRYRTAADVATALERFAVESDVLALLADGSPAKARSQQAGRGPGRSRRKAAAKASWQVFQVAIGRHLCAATIPATAGQIRRELNVGRPLTDFTRALRQLVKRGEAKELAAQEGGRAPRYLANLAGVGRSTDADPPPPAPARRWYYAEDPSSPGPVSLERHCELVAKGRLKRGGPVSLDQLHQFVAEGRLQPTDMLLEVGATTWSQAASVQGLFPPELSAGARARHPHRETPRT